MKTQVNNIKIKLKGDKIITQKSCMLVVLISVFSILGLNELMAQVPGGDQNSSAWRRDAQW